MLAVLLVLPFAACVDEGEPAEPALEDTTEIPAASVMDTAAVSVSLDVAERAPYGQYLTNGDGQALYLFTADTRGESSACYEACAQAWPPLLTGDDSVDAAAAVDTSLIGTLERRDGAMQITYNGWPLYTFQQDAGSGTVEGQDVHGFGGEWYLVSPAGQQIEAEADE